MNLFDDRSCVICHATFAGALVHCCGACGHSLARHSDGLKCSICKNACGIDCRPIAMRAHDRWPVRFPWLTARPLTCGYPAPHGPTKLDRRTDPRTRRRHPHHRL